MNDDIEQVVKDRRRRNDWPLEIWREIIDEEIKEMKDIVNVVWKDSKEFKKWRSHMYTIGLTISGSCILGLLAYIGEMLIRINSVR